MRRRLRLAVRSVRLMLVGGGLGGYILFASLAFLLAASRPLVLGSGLRRMTH